MSTPLLEIRDLSLSLAGSPPVGLTDRISLMIPRGRVVALVGESGCGKSLTALSILRLLPKPAVSISAGQILWHGRAAMDRHNSPVDIVTLPERELRSIRGRDITMVFQEPMTALNPVLSVGEQIAEGLILHRRMSRKEAWAEAAELLDRAGIPDPQRRVREYPHQFSGGMRQRVLIAMAIACRPRLLIADEPTTALDVTVQAQILDLLTELQSETGMSILLITHDLGVVARMADLVYVMYAGRIIEHAPVSQLFDNPLHPYTKGLFACTPRLDQFDAPLRPIPGTVPDPVRFPSGCRFHPRCELTESRAALSRHKRTLDTGATVLARCVESVREEPSGIPPLREFRQGHFVSCWEIDPPEA